MANKILPKRSYTAAMAPTAEDLEVNELAINWADGIAYTKNAAGEIVSVAMGGGGGSGQADIRWNLFLPPAPTALSGSGADGEVALSWTAPSVLEQTPITDYVVQYSSDAGTTWSTFADGTSTATTATVTGLTNGTEYTFRVAAVSGIGQGAWSDASAAVTPAGLAVPETISGLQLWLDASDDQTLYDATSGGSLVAADGGVARWEDKSGNARHATQGTAGSRPARKTSAQNGLDVIRGDGTDDLLLTAAFSSDLVRSVFVVGVSRETPQADTFACLLGQADSQLGSDGDDAWLFGTTNGGTGGNHDRLRCLIRDSSDTAFVTDFVDTAFVTNSPFLASYINNGTGVYRYNGTAKTFGTAGLHRTVSKEMGILCQPNTGSNPNNQNFWDGDICEIIIYDSALSDTDRAAVENYLLAKWSIT